MKRSTMKVSVAATLLSIAGSSQAITIEFAGSGWFNTASGVIGTARPEDFTGQLTYEINPAGPTATSDQTSYANASGYNWVISDFLIRWDDQEFSLTPSANQSHFASVVDGKNASMNDQLTITESLFLQTATTNLSQSAMLTVFAADHTWLSGTTFPELTLSQGIGAQVRFSHSIYDRTTSANSSFGGRFDLTSLTPLAVAVPEPSTLALLMLGVIGVGARRRRRG